MANKVWRQSLLFLKQNLFLEVIVNVMDKHVITYINMELNSLVRTNWRLSSSDGWNQTRKYKMEFYFFLIAKQPLPGHLVI